MKAYIVTIVKRGSTRYDLVICIGAKKLGLLDKIVTDIRQMEEVEQNSTPVGA